MNETLRIVLLWFFGGCVMFFSFMLVRQTLLIRDYCREQRRRFDARSKTDERS